MKELKHFIYVHQNKFNLKIYVGYSSRLKRRWQATKSTAFNINDPQYNEPLYNAIRRDGWDNFEHQIIEEFDNKEDALGAEKFWIEFFRSNRKIYGKEYGYNLHEGGNLPPIIYGNQHAKGAKHTEEWKNNMSVVMTGHPSYTKGMKFSDETKEKMSKSAKGKPKPHFKNKTWKLIGGKRVWMEKEQCLIF